MVEWRKGNTDGRRGKVSDRTRGGGPLLDGVGWLITDGGDGGGSIPLGAAVHKMWMILIDEKGGGVMGHKKMVEVTGWTFKMRTNTAILVTDGTHDVWIPLSLIEELAGYVGDELDEKIMELESFTVPEWLGVQKGLV